MEGTSAVLIESADTKTPPQADSHPKKDRAATAGGSESMTSKHTSPALNRPFHRARGPKQAASSPNIGSVQHEVKGPTRSQLANSQSPAADPPKSLYENLQELTEKANSGCPSALSGLREFLDRHPEIWRHVGDVGAVAERTWINLLAGNNQLFAECTCRYLADLKAQLAGPDPSPVETVLTKLAGVTLLATMHGEMAAANCNEGSREWARFNIRRADSANKRFTNVIKTLTTVRSSLANASTKKPLPKSNNADPESLQDNASLPESPTGN